MGEVPANVRGWHRQDYKLELTSFTHISCVGDNLKQIGAGQLGCPQGEKIWLRSMHNQQEVSRLAQEYDQLDTDKERA